MAVKRFKPVTPGTRFRVGADNSDITTNVPEKSLVVSHKRSGGRNNTGKMTMRYMGGGHKQSYRIIDFKRDKHDIPAVVATIEYDPNRSARIALLHFADGEKKIHDRTRGPYCRSNGSFRRRFSTRSWKYLTIKEHPVRFYHP